MINYHYSSGISEVPVKCSTGILVQLIQLVFMLNSSGIPPLFQWHTTVTQWNFRNTCKILHWYISGSSTGFTVDYHCYSSGILPLFQWNFKSTCKIFHWYISGKFTCFPVEFLWNFIKCLQNIPLVYNGKQVKIPGESSGIPLFTFHQCNLNPLYLEYGKWSKISKS